MLDSSLQLPSHIRRQCSGCIQPQQNPCFLVSLAIFVPIKLRVLGCWLQRYPDRRAASILLNGFTVGFRIGYVGPRECLPYAAQRPQIVRDKLIKEASLGRIAGPFAARPLSGLQCSPIGLVPKHEPGVFRLIHHLSYNNNNNNNQNLYSALH